MWRGCLPAPDRSRLLGQWLRCCQNGPDYLNCYDAGATLLYLPPYSPDLNPIEDGAHMLPPRAGERKSPKWVIARDAASGVRISRCRIRWAL